jgi:hypothetical protein
MQVAVGTSVLQIGYLIAVCCGADHGSLFAAVDLGRANSHLGPYLGVWWSSLACAECAVRLDRARPVKCFFVKCVMTDTGEARRRSQVIDSVRD